MAVEDLAFFQCLARAGSLTEAARELGLSLSAVSKRLRHLETRLGVQLAARTTRRLSLTPEGERYLARGAAILDDLAELEESLAERRGGLAGRLSVNATFGFGRRHVAPLLSAFAAQHPALALHLELTNFPLSLTDADVDIGIRIGPPPDARLVARRLLANRRILCASPRYLANAPPLASPADLAAHACLLVRENDTDYALWRFDRVSTGEDEAGGAEIASGATEEGDEARRAVGRTAGSLTVKVGGRLASNDAEVVARMALDGHGIMLRSWWDIHEPLARGELVALLPAWQSPRADFYAVYLQRRQVPERLRACVEFLRQGMAGRVPALPQAT